MDGVLLAIELIWVSLCAIFRVVILLGTSAGPSGGITCEASAKLGQWTWNIGDCKCLSATVCTFEQDFNFNRLAQVFLLQIVDGVPLSIERL